MIQNFWGYIKNLSWFLNFLEPFKVQEIFLEPSRVLKKRLKNQNLRFFIEPKWFVSHLENLFGSAENLQGSPQDNFTTISIE